MNLKKKKDLEENNQEDALRERVENLQKEEEKERRADKPKYLPDRQTVTVVITAVLCFMIVVGGVYMVSRLRENGKYNADNLSGNSSVYTGGSSSSKTESSSLSSITASEPPSVGDPAASEPSSAGDPAASEPPVGDNSGYHPIRRPGVSSSTADMPKSEAPSSTANPGAESTQPESSSSGVEIRGYIEDVDVGALFH